MRLTLVSDDKTIGLSRNGNSGHRHYSVSYIDVYKATDSVTALPSFSLAVHVHVGFTTDAAY